MTFSKNDDQFLGLEVNRYKITKYINKGKIGRVYKAVREDIGNTLACKIIPLFKLKEGWQRELEKVVLLSGIEGVVQYRMHDTALDRSNMPFVWVLWEYIDGCNLNQYLKSEFFRLNLAFIEQLMEAILKVLLACSQTGIQHGDLHEGNILIQKPDPRQRGNPSLIKISDFGYGGSHNDKEPKDDFRQLYSIISNLLKKLTPSELNPRDKALYPKLRNFLDKRIMEVDPTQKGHRGDVLKLLDDFDEIRKEAEHDAATPAGHGFKRPGDYLAAEHLGYQADEWKNLFVPEFLAAEELLSKNITILTGARGCGKTMVFRRLTAYMDKVIGELSGVKGADQFVGFYLNCRNLAEAFPWLPLRLKQKQKKQVMHFFHLAWTGEVFKTLAIFKEDYPQSFEWLDEFIARLFGDLYQSMPKGTDILSHVSAFIEVEKEECRKGNRTEWPLARIDFIKILQQKLERNVNWIGEKPLFFFLDDYTTPNIPRQVQRILNPIIFSRSSKYFFKISSESTNSFEKSGIRGKPLELHNDFQLIDLATESLHQGPASKEILLSKIFKPRIQRHEPFQEKGLTLADVLGKMPYSNNELAKKMRRQETVVYHGKEAFVGMWSSDIRIMIQMFTYMLREAGNSLTQGNFKIKKEIQDKVYKTMGGEFLELMENVVVQRFLEKDTKFSKKQNKSDIQKKHGTHLKDIVEAFVKISRYELTEGALISNQGRLNPKQAFRLEIVDKFEITDEVKPILDSLIRWHIFLQDWRGKSIRGMITPRLYLNRILLPFCKLTFSMHDNIHLSNKEFIWLLSKPTKFYEYWKDKRMGEKKNANQKPLEFPSQ